MRAQRPGESALLLLDTIEAMAETKAGGTVDVDFLRKLATRFGRATVDALELLLRSVPNE